MKQEIFYLNVARVLACIMVVSLHSLPTVPLYGIDSQFFTLVLLFTRPCVPFFFMVTGVLLLPFTGGDILSFYKKRISRIFFPFLFWGIIYSILPYIIGIETLNQMFSNFFLLIITFPKEIGGVLWYLYILMGLYLIVPFINPKIFKEWKLLRIFLLIWLIASLISVIKVFYPQILGMVSVSPFDMLHYFSGPLGYLFLGYYIHHYFSCKKETIRSYFKFYLLLTGVYFLATLVIYLVLKEALAIDSEALYVMITGFLSFPVIIMASVFFIAIKEWKFNVDGRFYRFVKHLSPLTFGIYLSQMVIFRIFTGQIYQISTSPMMQLVVMIVTFFGAYLLTLLFSKFSYSKYIIG
jgi:surface polysaccharide O-acyltransferase-like enzyme